MAAAGAGEVGAGEVGEGDVEAGEVGVEVGVEGVAESHARVPGWCVTRHVPVAPMSWPRPGLRSSWQWMEAVASDPREQPLSPY